MSSYPLPTIIQGGMGIGISGWRLARAVSRTGQLGVVAGTALDRVLTRRLQSGDPGGHVRRALEHFPFPEVARRVLEREFVPDGKAAGERFREKALGGIDLTRGLVERLVVGNFVEVFLAREGHDAPVGINYLTKVQLPTLPSLFGALLAGVGHVFMGAGIPVAIPEVLDRLSAGRSVELAVDVHGETTATDFLRFDPREFCGTDLPEVARPRFHAIVSSHTIATRLLRSARGAIDGFVVEGPRAGGHSAPPRDRATRTASGEPVYGARDEADLAKLADLGLPFWLAGAYGSPERLAEARTHGARGVQLGTAFAYCAESGLPEAYKRFVIEGARAGTLDVFNDPLASPTGFPFKVVPLPGSMADDARNAERTRVCDVGYLRTTYRRADGSLGYRCPGEPVADYVAKGGRLADTIGRKCLCNGLLATIGLGQVQRDGRPEPPLVTAGNDLSQITRFLADGETSYTAEHVVRTMLRG